MHYRVGRAGGGPGGASGGRRARWPLVSRGRTERGNRWRVARALREVGARSFLGPGAGTRWSGLLTGRVGPGRGWDESRRWYARSGAHELSRLSAGAAAEVGARDECRQLRVLGRRRCASEAPQERQERRGTPVSPRRRCLSAMAVYKRAGAARAVSAPLSRKQTDDVASSARAGRPRSAGPEPSRDPARGKVTATRLCDTRDAIRHLSGDATCPVTAPTIRPSPAAVCREPRGGFRRARSARRDGPGA